MAKPKMGISLLEIMKKIFSYTFTISESTKEKYLIKVELYTNTRFPVREFIKRVEKFSEINELNETLYSKCKKLSKEMDRFVE